MGDQTGIKINTQQQIIYTKTEHSYVISRRDWNRIKKTIDSLTLDSITWSNVAWGTLGIGCSCLLSWFTGVKFIWLIVVGCTALGVSLCSFVGTHSDKIKHKGSVDNLKEVIQDIEDAITSKDSTD